MATSVDVMLTLWVGVSFTSPVRKMAGNFCNKALTSAGTESGIFSKEGGGSNRDWFSLELKLDDFTSGFRTTCADMAGGCEEVVAVGSWIGTGAGTSEELNKHGEADEAAENKKEAGETAEGRMRVGEAAGVHANCIWLISVTTVTLNFLKKSMPRLGPATAACKNLDVISLPWNCTVFWMKPQGEIGCPSAPLRRGPDGLEFWL